jgi:hypothetical protein
LSARTAGGADHREHRAFPVVEESADGAALAAVVGAVEGAAGSDRMGARKRRKRNTSLRASGLRP